MIRGPQSEFLTGLDEGWKRDTWNKKKKKEEKKQTQSNTLEQN